MTMACNPIDQQPVRTLSDPSRDNTGGHFWTPTDFKSAKQADPEHLDRLGLMETQIGGTHYLGKKFQVWDVVAEYGLDFWEGNCLKYLLRRKPGTERITDLRKARHYLDQCIAREEAKGG